MLQRQAFLLKPRFKIFYTTGKIKVKGKKGSGYFFRTALPEEDDEDTRGDERLAPDEEAELPESFTVLLEIPLLEEGADREDDE